MKSSSSWILLVGSAWLAACGGDDRSTQDGDGAVVNVGDSGFSPDAGDGLSGDLDASIGIDSGLDGSLASEAGTGIVGDGGSPFPTTDGGQVLCGTALCQCDDGIDQDSDGLTDQDDPECVSAWDNDESTFATGISGDNRDEACQDCFFDGNSGSGNDGCRVATSCLTDPTDSSSGQGSCATCTANDQCRNFCRAYTPNGCDCFGCCTVQLGSGIEEHVQIGNGCDINGTTLSAECVQCVPSTSCANTCGRCELCPGKTLADLPADCGTVGGDSDGGVADGGTTSDGGTTTPTPTCDDGEARCGDGLPSCPSLKSCSFGCCIETPLL